MKTILLTILLSTILNAAVEVKQNLKALYKNVQLTEDQENFILDNKEIMRRIISSKIKKDFKYYKRNTINEKCVIEYILSSTDEMKNFKYLKRSSSREYDKKIKAIIEKTVKKFPRPETETPLRFIIKYNNTYKIIIKAHKETKTEEHYQRIPKGTSRFPYSSKEIIRTFEARKDGYMNITNNMCANITILTMQNQRVRIGYSYWNINEPIKKGKYKMLIKTKKKCDLHVQYP